MSAMATNLTGYRARKLYAQVLNRIRRSHRPGDRLGTQVELAREYRVSVQTMQRVLGALARQGWVVCSRRSGTFVSPRPAEVGRRVLRLMTTRPRALPASPFRRELFAWVAYRVAEMGAWLGVVNPAAGGDADRGSPADAWRRAVDNLDLAEVDALLALAPEDPTPLAELAERLPVVIIDSDQAGKPRSTVCLDYRRIVAGAMDRLGDLGHGRVGFWGLNFAEHGPGTRACYQAYLDWSAQTGRVPARPWLTLAESNEQYSQSAEKFATLPADARPTELLVCGRAREAAEELAGRGILPGRDISIVAIGADDQLGATVGHSHAGPGSGSCDWRGFSRTCPPWLSWWPRRFTAA